MSLSDSIEHSAANILREFESYLGRFTSVTRRAQRRFEKMDWTGGRLDAAERLTLYDESLSFIGPAIADLLARGELTRDSWPLVKHAFSRMVQDRCDRAVAETFFNSVTRKVFGTRGINREFEYFYLEAEAFPAEFCTELFDRSERQSDAAGLIRDILERHRFDVPYEDIDRDVARIANEVNLFLWPLTRKQKQYDAEILRHVFFRNKAAYIVGRLLVGRDIIPLVIPLYNETGGIRADAVLLTAADVSNVFGFAYSYFHVVAKSPVDLVRFLHTILPAKPLSEIYNSIGFYKHGKTVFYRDLHRFVHLSKEQYVIAPGLEGAVMIVFTLPNFNYVIKVIKDRPCFLRSPQVTMKTITMEQVREKYRFVSGRDRVGRLVDTQEFEYLRFKRSRYSEQVLDEFRRAAQRTITLEGEHVLVNHCYIQRKVIPLPLFLEHERDPERIRQVVLDFGYFIKDLAGTGLFPSDLFNKWNYGVTERSRVVLYDYDDIMPIEDMRFRVKPPPRDDDETWQADEDRITAEEFDFFMDEIERWLGIPLQLKGIFDTVHADLYTQAFWDESKRRIERGAVADIFPYDRGKRFNRSPFP